MQGPNGEKITFELETYHTGTCSVSFDACANRPRKAQLLTFYHT